MTHLTLVDAKRLAKGLVDRRWCAQDPTRIWGRSLWTHRVPSDHLDVLPDYPFPSDAYAEEERAGVQPVILRISIVVARDTTKVRGDHHENSLFELEATDLPPELRYPSAEVVEHGALPVIMVTVGIKATGREVCRRGDHHAALEMRSEHAAALRTQRDRSVPLWGLHKGIYKQRMSS